MATMTTRRVLYKRTRMGPMRRREAIAGMLFVFPWLLSLMVFTAYPVIAAFYLSFTDYTIVQPPRWVGFQNYQTMFTTDPAFWISVSNSAYYAFLSVPLGLLVSLVLALLLNIRAKGIGVYRTMFYLPALAPPVASTIIFILMFDPRAGLINEMLKMVGLPAVGWLTDPQWSKPALILLSLWSVGSGASGVPGGAQGDSTILDRRGCDRRCRGVATLPSHHDAVAFSGDSVQPGDGRDRLVPGFYPGPCHRQHYRQTA